MILYLAGGFHFSNKVENELELGKHLVTKYNKYNRLATYFYEQDAANIMEATHSIQGELDEDKGTFGGNTKGNASSRRKINRRSD